MAFLSIGKDGNSKPKQARLYIMQITIAEKDYFKIGKSSGHSSKERMLAIAGSFFDKYRFLPTMKIIRDQKCDDAFKCEAALHRFFTNYQFLPIVAFSGSTEIYDVVEYKDDVIQAYEAVLAGYETDECYMRPEDEVQF